MKKFTWALLALALIIVSSIGFLSSGAWFVDHERTSGNLVQAAVLDLTASGGNSTIDLGEVSPGDMGLIELSLRNSGTISGVLKITPLGSFPDYMDIDEVSSCNCEIAPGGDYMLEVTWNLPLEVNDMGLDGKTFEVSYQMVFENGFRVVRVVKIVGKVLDPIDPTVTPTVTLTPTSTIEIGPASRGVIVITDTPTEEPENSEIVDPTATLTPTPVENPEEVVITTVTPSLTATITEAVVGTVTTSTLTPDPVVEEIPTTVTSTIEPELTDGQDEATPTPELPQPTETIEIEPTEEVVDATQTPTS